MKQPYRVVFASDDNGVEPLGVAVYSLLATAARKTVYRVYILSDGISAENRDRLAQIAKDQFARHSIIFHDLTGLLRDSGLPSTANWPKTAWARVFIPGLLPKEKGTVLYCDIDILVCRDLAELFNTPLDGKAIGVVLEHLSHENSHFNERLHIPLQSPGYFNSGIMLMDLDAFRQQKLVDRILDYAKIYSENLTCPDQDALNGTLHDNLKPIHHKWNWHDGLTRLLLKRSSTSGFSRGASLEVAVEAALRPGILHYQGPNKPWRYNHRIEGKRYEKVLRASGFGIYPLPGRTPGKWLKSALYTPVYWLTRLRIKNFDQQFQRSRQENSSSHQM